MARIVITGENKWFDDEKSEFFKGTSFYDGQNWIQKSTRAQFYGENLFLTASKSWVLNTWSAYQGVSPTYSIISTEDAMNWFLKNEMFDELERFGSKHLAQTEI